MTGNWMIDGDIGINCQSPYFISLADEFEKAREHERVLKNAFDIAPERLDGELHEWRIVLESLENPNACFEEIKIDYECSMHIVNGKICIDFTFYE